MFTLAFLLMFHGIKSKNVHRPCAYSETNLQLFNLENDWAEVAELIIGAYERQNSAPPCMAVLLLGLMGAILYSHFSAKLPLKLKGRSKI